MRPPEKTCAVIYKAFLLIDLLQKRKAVTVRQIAEELGVTHSCAFKYMKTACAVLPIWSDNEENRGPHEPIRYRLMKGE